jgi:hypothetical protein
MNFKLLGKPQTTFNNYKKVALYIPIGLTCSKKCIKNLLGVQCLNEHLYSTPLFNYSISEIINIYQNNCFAESIILSGLEPFDSFDNLINFIHKFRLVCQDDVVIYSGYNKNEINDKIIMLQQFNNIIVKFGRYTPNQCSRFDEVLGIVLISDNQYAEKIS